ncbi:MAG: PIN domain nuclease [Actinomycetota bacterium]
MPTYLADTSAWHRQSHVAERWISLVERDDLVLCTPVALELLYSARSRTDYKEIALGLDGFQQLPLDSRCEALAMQTQALLAANGQHRGPAPVDLLIAAIADAYGVTLLHYDRHFDAIAQVTGQPAEWLARRGSLD